MLVAQNSLGPVCPVPLTVRGKLLDSGTHGGVARVPQRRQMFKIRAARLASTDENVVVQALEPVWKSNFGRPTPHDLTNYFHTGWNRPVRVMTPCATARVATCVEIKIYGAVVLNRRVVLHAIDAALARWRTPLGWPTERRARLALATLGKGAAVALNVGASARRRWWRQVLPVRLARAATSASRSSFMLRGRVPTAPTAIRQTRS